MTLTAAIRPLVILSCLTLIPFPTSTVCADSGAKLLLHYPLDETQGDKVSEASGQGQDGLVKGKASWSKGKVGGSLSFDGSTKIDLGDQADFAETDSFTYGAWIQPLKDSRAAIIARLDESQPGYKGHEICYQDGNLFVSIIHSYPNAIRVRTEEKFELGKWHHVMLTYNGSQTASGVKLYVNGEVQKVRVEADKLTGSIQNDVPLSVGRRSNSSAFVGSIDDVRIYRGVLSAEEIENLVTGTATSAPAKRADLPEKDQIEEALASLEEEHKLRFRASRTVEKIALAKQLRALVSTEDELVKRYVLLDTAIDLATDTKDLEFAWECCDVLAVEFEFDVLERKEDVLKRIARLMRTPADRYQLTAWAHQLARDAVLMHEYNTASKLMSLALNYSKFTKLDSMVAQITEELRDIKDLENRFEKIETERTAFAKDSDNTEAALAWGKFLCLDCSQWSKGLPILAKGGNDHLAKLAQSDRAGVANVADALKLLDNWSDELNRTSDERHQQAIRKHLLDLAQNSYSKADENQRSLLDQKIALSFDQPALIETEEEDRGVLIGGENANLGAEGTIEFWFRTTDREGWMIIKREEQADGSIGVHLHNSTLTLYAQGDGYIAQQDSEIPGSDGEWHHLAICKQGQFLSLFLDGEVITRIEIKEGFSKPSRSPWRLGYSPWIPNRKLDASFARVRISSAARYHVPFTPSPVYGLDRATLYLR